ncbi:MAG: PEP-CTERM sorting domain-containing protein [Candidatus Accumulibacter phosphatis]|nr:PEP-CTERM sorting domain-containing protein [Candidatus Accumulibacter phosphatis]
MKKNLLVAVFAATMMGSAIAGPTYVGSWIVGNGPWWETNPVSYSGQEVAALLWGGSPSDYSISTVDANPLNINHLTFLDGWGNDQYLFSPQSETFKLQTNTGYNDPGGSNTAYSAYVLDHSCNNRYSDSPPGSVPNNCSGYGEEFVNYAFRNDVPEPGMLGLLGFGLAGLAGMRRRKGA